MFLEKFTIMSICPMGKSSTNFIDVGQVQQCYKYSLVNYHECFIKIKTRVAAKCFRLEKTRTASLLTFIVDLFILPISFRLLIFSPENWSQKLSRVILKHSLNFRSAIYSKRVS